MNTTAYVIDPDPDERKRIEAFLSPGVEVVCGLDDAEALLAVLGVRDEVCLIVSLEPNEEAVRELVCELRLSGSEIPVIVVGSRTAFRAATKIARLEFTDFLQRPLTAHKLRAAVERLCGARRQHGRQPTPAGR
jgi:DNA-binding NtrC family response regulator